MFGVKKNKDFSSPTSSGRLPEFSYSSDDDIYMDAACQSLRPQPVIDALTDYYQQYNACGGRVKYKWGQRVDAEIEAARTTTLKLLGLSSKEYVTAFTLNTTMGLNLLLQQLPAGQYKKVVTSEIEHNSVFLPTITLAKRLDLPRQVLERSPGGAVLYDPAQLEDAIVVINAVSNIDGRTLENIKELIRDTHKGGGVVIIDAAQAMAHSHQLLVNCGADAICFSAHKMYAASLGVITARKDLIASLASNIVGGGMVQSVTESDFELVTDDLASRLEPGLQPYGEIIAYRAALGWLEKVKPHGVSRHQYIQQLSRELYDGLGDIPGVKMVNQQASPVISLYVESMDSHQLAVFLSAAGIMVRSGYFCCHYYLHQKLKSPPLLRFSLGLHNTAEDVQHAINIMQKITRKG